jgi:P pilus assembly chaperone PapD
MRRPAGPLPWLRLRNPNSPERISAIQYGNSMVLGRPLFVALILTPLLSASIASAAQLRVEPVSLELGAPAAAGILTLRNDDDVEVTAQTRVFRWSQSAGKETLEPTTDVVASPPTVTLSPHADYVVRVVRVTKQPVQGEENYRVFVDQIPQPPKQTARHQSARPSIDSGFLSCAAAFSRRCVMVARLRGRQAGRDGPQ